MFSSFSTNFVIIILHKNLLYVRLKDMDRPDMNNSLTGWVGPSLASTASRPHASLTSLVVNLPNSTEQHSTFSSSPSHAFNGHQNSHVTTGHRLFPDQNSPTSSSRVQETVLILHCKLHACIASASMSTANRHCLREVS
jgi:hypothetical protein